MSTRKSTRNVVLPSHASSQQHSSQPSQRGGKKGQNTHGQNKSNTPRNKQNEPPSTPHASQPPTTSEISPSQDTTPSSTQTIRVPRGRGSGLTHTKSIVARAVPSSPPLDLPASPTHATNTFTPTSTAPLSTSAHEVETAPSQSQTEIPPVQLSQPANNEELVVEKASKSKSTPRSSAKAKASSASKSSKSKAKKIVTEPTEVIDLDAEEDAFPPAHPATGATAGASSTTSVIAGAAKLSSPVEMPPLSKKTASPPKAISTTTDLAAPAKVHVLLPPQVTASTLPPTTEKPKTVSLRVPGTSPPSSASAPATTTTSTPDPLHSSKGSWMRPITTEEMAEEQAEEAPTSSASKTDLDLPHSPIDSLSVADSVSSTPDSTLATPSSSAKKTRAARKSKPRMSSAAAKRAYLNSSAPIPPTETHSEEPVATSTPPTSARDTEKEPETTGFTTPADTSVSISIEAPPPIEAVTNKEVEAIQEDPKPLEASVATESSIIPITETSLPDAQPFTEVPENVPEPMQVPIEEAETQEIAPMEGAPLVKRLESVGVWSGPAPPIITIQPPSSLENLSVSTSIELPEPRMAIRAPPVPTTDGSLETSLLPPTPLITPPGIPIVTPFTRPLANTPLVLNPVPQIETSEPMNEREMLFSRENLKASSWRILENPFSSKYKTEEDLAQPTMTKNPSQLAKTLKEATVAPRKGFHTQILEFRSYSKDNDQDAVVPDSATLRMVRMTEEQKKLYPSVLKVAINPPESDDAWNDNSRITYTPFTSAETKANSKNNVSLPEVVPLTSSQSGGTPRSRGSTAAVKSSPTPSTSRSGRSAPSNGPKKSVRFGSVSFGFASHLTPEQVEKRVQQEEKQLVGSTLSPQPSSSGTTTPASSKNDFLLSYVPTTHGSFTINEASDEIVQDLTRVALRWRKNRTTPYESVEALQDELLFNVASVDVPPSYYVSEPASDPTPKSLAQRFAAMQTRYKDSEGPFWTPDSISQSFSQRQQKLDQMAKQGIPVRVKLPKPPSKSPKVPKPTATEIMDFDDDDYDEDDDEDYVASEARSRSKKGAYDEDDDYYDDDDDEDYEFEPKSKKAKTTKKGVNHDDDDDEDYDAVSFSQHSKKAKTATSKTVKPKRSTPARKVASPHATLYSPPPASKMGADGPATTVATSLAAGTTSLGLSTQPVKAAANAKKRKRVVEEDEDGEESSVPVTASTAATTTGAGLSSKENAMDVTLPSGTPTTASKKGSSKHAKTTSASPSSFSNSAAAPVDLASSSAPINSIATDTSVDSTVTPSQSGRRAAQRKAPKSTPKTKITASQTPVPPAEEQKQEQETATAVSEGNVDANPPTKTNDKDSGNEATNATSSAASTVPTIKKAAVTTPIASSFPARPTATTTAAEPTSLEDRMFALVTRLISADKSLDSVLMWLQTMSLGFAHVHMNSARALSTFQASASFGTHPPQQPAPAFAGILAGFQQNIARQQNSLAERHAEQRRQQQQFDYQHRTSLLNPGATDPTQPLFPVSPRGHGPYPAVSPAVPQRQKRSHDAMLPFEIASTQPLPVNDTVPVNASMLISSVELEVNANRPLKQAKTEERGDELSEHLLSPTLPPNTAALDDGPNFLKKRIKHFNSLNTGAGEPPRSQNELMDLDADKMAHGSSTPGVSTPLLVEGGSTSVSIIAEDPDTSMGQDADEGGAGIATQRHLQEYLGAEPYSTPPSATMPVPSTTQILDSTQALPTQMLPTDTLPLQESPTTAKQPFPVAAHEAPPALRTPAQRVDAHRPANGSRSIAGGAILANVVSPPHNAPLPVPQQNFALPYLVFENLRSPSSLTPTQPLFPTRYPVGSPANDSVFIPSPTQALPISRTKPIPTSALATQSAPARGIGQPVQLEEPLDLDAELDRLATRCSQRLHQALYLTSTMFSSTSDTDTLLQAARARLVPSLQNSPADAQPSFSVPSSKTSTTTSFFSSPSVSLLLIKVKLAQDQLKASKQQLAELVAKFQAGEYEPPLPTDKKKKKQTSAKSFKSSAKKTAQNASKIASLNIVDGNTQEPLAPLPTQQTQDSGDNTTTVNVEESFRAQEAGLTRILHVHRASLMSFMEELDQQYTVLHTALLESMRVFTDAVTDFGASLRRSLTPPAP